MGDGFCQRPRRPVCPSASLGLDRSSRIVGAFFVQQKRSRSEKGEESLMLNFYELRDAIADDGEVPSAFEKKQNPLGALAVHKELSPLDLQATSRNLPTSQRRSKRVTDLRKTCCKHCRLRLRKLVLSISNTKRAQLAHSQLHSDGECAARATARRVPASVCVEEPAACRPSARRNAGGQLFEQVPQVRDAFA